MTENQKRFAEEYLKNGRNATQAYKAVYKSCKSDNAAGVSGQRLLRNVNVRAYIQEVTAQVQNNNILTIAQICENLTRIAENEDEETFSRIKSMELLGKYVSTTEIERRKYEIDKEKLEIEKRKLEIEQKKVEELSSKFANGEVKVILSSPELKEWGG